MPTYTYKCLNGHEWDVVEPMLAPEAVTWCGICDAEAFRKPQVVAVIWNGLPPHREHERGSELDQHLKSTDRNRDEYLEMHENDDND